VTPPNTHVPRRAVLVRTSAGVAAGQACHPRRRQVRAAASTTALTSAHTMMGTTSSGVTWLRTNGTPMTCHAALAANTANTLRT
jgi:hypothetical protein